MAKRGAMEPEVLELRDGRLRMIIRTQLGFIGTSYSVDSGKTWSEASRLPVKTGAATIRRIPATGDLLLVWNNNSQIGSKQAPLSASISRNEGKSWLHLRNLESDQNCTYSYTSVGFVRDRLLLNYWDQSDGEGYSCRFRSLPVR